MKAQNLSKTNVPCSCLRMKMKAQNLSKTLPKKSKTASYKEGGTVNAAGNYTKPEMRKRIVSQVT